MPERRKKKNLKSTRHQAARKKSGAAKTVSAKKPAPKAPAKAAGSAQSKGGTVSVFDLNGKPVESVTLDPIFHAEPVHTGVVYQAILAYQAGAREGTAATKTRGEVRGGGKKPWRQKGTGRARHASIRSPIWRGGGTVFGPHPRDYSYALPREIRRRAVIEGVKDKVAGGKFWLVKDLELTLPKTKLVAGILEKFKWEKPLLLVEKKSENLLRASRNLRQVSVKNAQEVNALDVVSHKECVLTKAAYSGLLKRLKS